MEKAESILPAGKKWKLVWNDEFEGTELDRTKWDFRLHMMQQRHSTWIEDEGISLNGDSSVLFHLVKKNGEFYSSQLQTGANFMDRPSEKPYTGKFRWPIGALAQPKFLKKYGYFECRCKFQKQPGWWSAFWLQSPIIGASRDPGQSGIEVDIMENFKRNGEYSHNMYWGGYGENKASGHSGPKFIAPDKINDWHIFAVDWSPDGYVFYVDGQETWRFNEAVSHTEQFILLTTECQSYRYDGKASDELKSAVLPDCFEVDFVRVYDQVK